MNVGELIEFLKENCFMTEELMYESECYGISDVFTLEIDNIWRDCAGDSTGVLRIGMHNSGSGISGDDPAFKKNKP